MPADKILVVDDERLVRWSLRQKCEEWGYQVLEAEGGEPALRVAQHESPDLVLLDVRLPDLSGLEVLARLKHNRDTAKIPVVAVSGLSEKNRQKLMDAGAEDYLEKNAVITDKGLNRLPKVLEDVICRINRKRGIPFSPILEKKGT